MCSAFPSGGGEAGAGAGGGVGATSGTGVGVGAGAGTAEREALDRSGTNWSGAMASWRAILAERISAESSGMGCFRAIVFSLNRSVLFGMTIHTTNTSTARMPALQASLGHNRCDNPGAESTLGVSRPNFARHFALEQPARGRVQVEGSARLFAPLFRGGPQQLPRSDVPVRWPYQLLVGRGNRGFLPRKHPAGDGLEPVEAFAQARTDGFGVQFQRGADLFVAQVAEISQFDDFAADVAELFQRLVDQPDFSAVINVASGAGAVLGGSIIRPLSGSSAWRETGTCPPPRLAALRRSR